MKPRLFKRSLPGTKQLIWYCTYNGQYAIGLTFKEAYNRIAYRWNTEVYSDRKLPYAK
jgi:hypothetical protein